MVVEFKPEGVRPDVATGISGSHCVVWRTREHYLDCRAHSDEMTEIECVRNGQVYRRIRVFNLDAPWRIVQTIREELL